MDVSINFEAAPRGAKKKNQLFNERTHSFWPLSPLEGKRALEDHGNETLFRIFSAAIG
jgi:hypothetical protein